MARHGRRFPIKPHVNTVNEFVYLENENCLDFDGTNDYVTRAGSGLLNSMAQLTLETWIYLDALPAQNYAPMAKEGSYRIIISSGGAVSFVVATVSNGWYTAGTSCSASGVTLTTGRWYHIAGTYDGSYVRLYIDGQLKGTGASSISGAIINSATNFTLGYAVAANVNYLNGKLEDTRVWTTGRSADNIRYYYLCSKVNPESNLVLNYRYNQGIPGGTNTGLTTALDMSGNGLNGTLTNFALSGSSSNWVASTAKTYVCIQPHGSVSRCIMV